MPRPRAPLSAGHGPPTTAPAAPRRRWCGQGGQTVPVLAIWLVVAASMAVGLVQVAGAASKRAAAEAAADASALAGAADGPDAARRVATANGARVVAYDEADTDVVVTVVRRGVRASARARWQVAAGPMWRGDGGPSPDARAPSPPASTGGWVPRRPVTR